QAQSDDAQDWFCLAICLLPFLVLLPGFAAYYWSSHGFALPAWLPPGDDAFRFTALLYGALYFFGKGLVVAQVHAARFQRSGRAVLDAGWVRLLLLRNADKRRDAEIEEVRKAGARRAAFADAAAAWLAQVSAR